MRILAIASRVLKELWRDKRTLILIFIAPILVMWLMNVMFSANSDTKVDLATIHVSQTVKTNLDRVKGVSVHEYKSTSHAKHELKRNKADGVIDYHHNKYDVTYANTDSSKTALTKQALKAALTNSTLTGLTGTVKQLQQVVQQTNPQMAANMSQHHQSTSAPQVTNHCNYGDSNTVFFAKIIPILLGFFIFLFVFLISGMGLLHERISGTLDRLLATPVKRSDIVYGYMISYGILAIIQATVIDFATIWLLKVEVVGNVFNIIFISLISALVALAFGILLSTLANSEFEMMQFIPIVVVPQVFFSGIIPLDSMAPWVKYIGNILPLTYTGDALTKIVMYGTPLYKLGGDILALLIFLIILVVLNIIGLKRYRKV